MPELLALLDKAPAIRVRSLRAGAQGHANTAAICVATRNNRKTCLIWFLSPPSVYATARQVSPSLPPLLFLARRRRRLLKA